MEVRRKIGPSDIEKSIKKLTAKRQHLNNYVIQMNSSYGRSGLTVHEILWEARSLERNVRLPKELIKLTIKNPQNLSDETLERAKLCLEDFVESYIAYFGVLQGQPTLPYT
jgi:hypothetical protein